MYQSPIEIITQKMRTQFEDNVFKAIQDYGIVVDKEELIKALQYDRGQYEKGYADGMLAQKSEWISVDERLPESGAHCILCCDMKRIDGTHSQYVCDGYFAERWKINAHIVDDDCAMEYNEEDDEYYLKEGWYEVIKNWDDYNSIVIDDTVTHWMPLPEAPKMKGGEE